MKLLLYSVSGEYSRMTEEEEKLMERYGITSEKKTVYYYMGHKYERLKDALNYAKIHIAIRAAASDKHS